jgi:hypothetical protein
VWSGALLAFALALPLAALAGAMTLIALGLRPLTPFGYGLGAGLGGAVLAALLVANLALPPAAALATSAPGTPMAQAQPPAALASATAPSPTRALPAVPTATRASVTAAPTTPAATRTPTNTLIPSLTPTQTITPAPTPVWAYISADQGGGAIIRESPSYQGGWVKSLLNGTLVQILPESAEADNVAWVKVRTAQGVEGWIVRGLLRTATPAPSW